MVAGVRAGLANCQEDLDPTPERLPLPAPVALAVLERAEEIIRIKNAQRGATNRKRLRACIATIAPYIFFCRGECGACAKRKDLIIDGTQITLRLRKVKGKNALKEDHKNTRKVLIEGMPRVAAAMHAFFVLTEKDNKKGTMR